jgi:hypothetical protein
MKMGWQSHAFLNQDGVIKDLSFRGNGFHEIISFLYNIHIWSYADKNYKIKTYPKKVDTIKEGDQMARIMNPIGSQSKI